MGFNSKTGAEAGRKSKRGAGVEITKMRQTLFDLANSILEDLNKNTLTKHDKIKLLQVVLSYSMPKLRQIDVELNVDDEELTKEDVKKINSWLENEY